MTALVPVMVPSAGCITVVDHDGEPTLTLVGEIDVETVSAYERTTAPVAEIAVVDLSEVSFLSSSAVSFLIRKTQPIRKRGQLPVVVGVSAHARRVLELLGATRLFAPSEPRFAPKVASPADGFVGFSARPGFRSW